MQYLHHTIFKTCFLLLMIWYLFSNVRISVQFNKIKPSIFEAKVIDVRLLPDILLGEG